MTAIFNKFSKSSKPYLHFKLDNHSLIINQINKLLSKILNRRSNLDSLSFLNSLEENEIELLISKFSNEYQKDLVKIFKPIIKSILKPYYNKFDYDNIRVGIQSKYKWGNKNANFNRKVYYDKLGIMHESLSQKNFCFPTRPHQDLANNGYRGSGIMIFYYQASKVNKNQSNMLFANFRKQPVLEKYSNKYGYGNQLTSKVYNDLTWYKPYELNSKNLIVMDPYTIHCSREISSISRIAFNIKIQPSNYNFLFEKNLKLFRSGLEKQISLNDKIKYLYEKICQLSKKNNRLNFELAVLSKILNNEKLMKFHFKKILNFNNNDKVMNEFLCGAFFKVSPMDINKKLIESLKKNRFKITKFSCADNLLNTIQ